MNRSLLLIIIGGVLVIALVATAWLVVPFAKITVTSNTPGVELDLDGKTYTINDTLTIRVRAKEYAYIAAKAGFASQKGFVQGVNNKEQKLKLELRELTKFEKVYQNYALEYPNTKVIGESDFNNDWMSVAIQDILSPSNVTVLLLRRDGANWKIVKKAQNEFTFSEVSDLPQEIQDWLISGERTEEGDPPA